MARHSGGWAELFEAYTFEDGNIWPVVLLVTLFAPLIAVRGCGREDHAPIIGLHGATEADHS
jgi:hypothetical protein